MAQHNNPPKTQSRCVVDEDAANRLKGRFSNTELFQQIQDASTRTSDPKARAPHCCYIHLIGFVPGLEEKSQGGEFQSETVENYIDKAVLYQNLHQLVDKRQEYVVFEDNPAPTLEKMMQQETQPSFSLLRQACSNFEKEAHMEMHYATCQRSYQYFVEKGIDNDEAVCICYFLLHWYL